MDLKHFTLQDILHFESRFRRYFMNTVEGYKNLALIGTRDQSGNNNLALFNSIVHIGATPPLIGFVHRPVTVPKQTFTNIQSSEIYTINLVHKGIVEAAHQTSARYEPGESEFAATGLTPEFSDHLAAPYVKESKIRFGMALREIIPIRSNGTYLVIGQVEELFLPEEIIADDGFTDLAAADTVACAGLDSYYLPALIGRYEYARAGEAIRKKS